MINPVKSTKQTQTPLALAVVMLTLSWLSTAQADVTAVASATPSTNTVVIGTGEKIGKRICYFDDKAYSKGAIIKVGTHYIQCGAENSFESNGALSWHPLSDDTISAPKKPNHSLN